MQSSALMMTAPFAAQAHPLQAQADKKVAAQRNALQSRQTELVTRTACCSRGPPHEVRQQTGCSRHAHSRKLQALRGAV